MEYRYSKNCKMERLIITTEAGYSLMPKEYEVEDGRITVTLLPHSAAVLKYKVLKNMKILSCTMKNDML